MTQIQTARYEQYLRRLFRLVEGNVLPEVTRDVSPVLDIEDAQDPALLFWRGHNLACGFAQSPAAAGVNSFVTIGNPAGSGKLIDILSFRLGQAGAVTVLIGGGAAPAGPGGKQFLDGRNVQTGTGAIPVAILGSATTAVISGFYTTLGAAAGETVTNLPIVLPPGLDARFTHNSLNTAIEVEFVWLERSAEESELSL